MGIVPKVFVLAATPVYFALGWWIAKKKILEKHDQNVSLKIESSLKVYFCLMSAVVIVGTIMSLIEFYKICKPLISNSFEKISIGGIYSARVVWFRLVVCSFNMNVVLEFLKGFSESVKKFFNAVIAVLKWSVQHIMNVISAVALYYAIYPTHSKEGNAFLITLAAFATLEWLVRDIFEKISLHLHVEDGYWFKLMYGVIGTEDE